MRIGAIVLFKAGKCVQSYGWNTFRALGDLQRVLNSLEEYHCDEVAIIRPVRNWDPSENFDADVKTIEKVKTMTPISFGGGIRTVDRLRRLKCLPIERLIFSSAFVTKNTKLLDEARHLFGHQAIQCILPVRNCKGDVEVYHSEVSKYIPFEDIDLRFLNSYANEIILYDVFSEGLQDQFNFDFLRDISLNKCKLIISGGVGPYTVKKALEAGIASVLVENKVLHKEYSIIEYKNAAKMS